MCFSLTAHGREHTYKRQIVPLLRRMLNLEQLTLCFTLSQPFPPIDGTCLENDILLYLPRLQTFNFNIITRGVILDNQFVHLSSKDNMRCKSLCTNVKLS